VTLAEAVVTLTGTQVAFSAAVDDRPRDVNGLVISTISGTSFGGRVGATNAPLDVTVTGPVVLAGGAITAIHTVAFGGPITLAADALLTAGGALTLSGPVDGAHALDVQAAGVSEFSAPIGATTPLQRLTVGGGGMTRLSGAARSVTTIGDQSYSDALDVLADTTFTASGGSLTSSGGLDLNTGAGVVNAAGTISGAISGSGSLRKAGAGTLRLSAGNPFAGTLVQAEGKLEVTGATPSASVSLTGGTLAGSGPVGAVTGSGGTLAPGLTSGLLSTAGLALGSSDTVALGLDGPVAGSGHDQLRVTGPVALGGATLSVSLGFSPALDERFTLVDNDGTDAVTGTFAGLPEGAILDLQGLHFTLSYAGGTDDNDVTLTRVLLAASVALADAPSGSSASGDSVTFTATVSGASPAPAGSVRFELDGTLGAPAALSGGTAQFTTSSLEAGNHTVIARYGGDADHAMTASAALIHTVQAPPHPPGTTPRDEPGAPTAPVPPVKALRVTGVLATPYCLASRAKVKGAGRDITFSFALSDPARVTARVQRRLTPATRARRTCLLRPDGSRGRPVSFRDVVAPSRPVGKRRPFAQAFDAKAGSVRIRLSSLTRGARLTPGWYRLLLTAVRADGSAVAPVDVQFLVLRR
jgi:autotransporter-associated beta strand protein